MSGRIFFLVIRNELHEFLHSPFLKDSHEWGSKGLHLVRWNLGDPSIPVNIAPGNLLEFKITCDIGVLTVTPIPRRGVLRQACLSILHLP